ncbi:hypothetical protein AXG93_3049s1000 [Marchantia polymorpha subsp. ruderalis]|uniref:Uncharacterized protein n=1 Tax=Marchantia polymorpha subsp. ruderalis TaxID=1480154 RepID=A0A176VI04_MARPO|nr:hypothetical protein AXG93_3049s1000 [Marchantia polymorpha subsp. ruderalis]
MSMSVMARRLGGVTPRRDTEDIELGSAEPTEPKSASSPFITVVLLLVGIILITSYSNYTPGSGNVHISTDDDDDDAANRVECPINVCGAIPILKQLYGEIMGRSLHMGPESCGVVSKLREEGNEVWGIQPHTYVMHGPLHTMCRELIKKGVVRIGDPSRIPYRAKSFSFVLVTGTLEPMNSKELNQTLRYLARVTTHRLVVIVGDGGDGAGRANVAGKVQKTPKPRSRSWWQRRLQGVGLEEDEDLARRFQTLQAATTFKTSSNIFHLRVPHSEQH